MITGGEGTEGGEPRGFDYAAVARYLAGESNDAEIAAIEARATVDAGFAAEVERLRVIWAAGVGPQPDVEAALRRVMGRPAEVGAEPSSAFARRGAPGTERRAAPVRVPRVARGVGVAPRGHRLVWGALAAALVLGVGVTAAAGLRGAGIGGFSVAAREYVAAAGQRLNVTLSDGSQFALGPSSRLRVPLTYGIGSREVELDGEAFFTVVHDAGRPFRVRARNARVTDVGTAFDVRAYSDDSVVDVAVAEGRVALVASASVPAVGRSAQSDGAPEATLGVGDVAVVSPAGRVVTGHVNDLAPYIGWTRGELVFHDAPLRDVARALERWYGVTIVVRDSALGRRPIDATYDMQSMTEVLGLVTSTVGAEYTRRGHAIEIVPGPAMMR